VQIKLLQVSHHNNKHQPKGSGLPPEVTRKATDCSPPLQVLWNNYRPWLLQN
jgi:hypothetical protein